MYNIKILYRLWAKNMSFSFNFAWNRTILPTLKGTNSYENVLRHMLKSSQKYANGLLKKIQHTSASIFFQFLVGSFLILFNMLFVNYVEKKNSNKHSNFNYDTI